MADPKTEVEKRLDRLEESVVVLAKENVEMKQQLERLEKAVGILSKWVVEEDSQRKIILKEGSTLDDLVDILLREKPND